jgi:hypothetical protein
MSVSTSVAEVSRVAVHVKGNTLAQVVVQDALLVDGVSKSDMLEIFIALQVTSTDERFEEQWGASSLSACKRVMARWSIEKHGVFSTHTAHSSAMPMMWGSTPKMFQEGQPQTFMMMHQML